MPARWTRFGASLVLAAGLIACVPVFAHPADDRPGATVDDLLAAGRQLSPVLRAAALETAAAAARAGGADALDDPTVSDSYQYYKNPGVFSAHTLMLSQSFPLWGKRDLRREAAFADLDSARGREQAARDELDEKIKAAYAQYYLINRDIAVNREVGELAGRMHAASLARYGQGGGDQTSVIQALGEQTTAKSEAIRLAGEKDAIRARLNALVGRSGDAPLTEPVKMRPMPAVEPVLAILLDRARAANPTLSADSAAIEAAKSRSGLADKAWYPDLMIGGGPLIQTNNRPVGFAATIGFNIPLPWGREASGQQEATAQLGATQQRYAAALIEIEGALGEAIARLHAAQATEALVQNESIPQARASFQTVLAGYSQGKGDLTAAIAAEHRIHETEFRLLQTQFDEQVELAAIERLIGGEL
ncbi:MAG: outer membrane protein heavy metal efflux system [Aliidongia sp.]|nr:outer membrane protein heavy metal efflux system [Aliidongia sp.]